MAARVIALKTDEGATYPVQIVGAPVLGIIGGCDRPDPRLVVLAFRIDRTGRPDLPEGYCWIYVNRSKADRKPWDSWHFTDELTALAAFGVRAVLMDGFLDGHKLYCFEEGISSATYRDGSPRRWQAPDGAYTIVRADLVDDLMAAVASGETAVCPLTSAPCSGTPLSDYREEGCVECHEAIDAQGGAS